MTGKQRIAAAVLLTRRDGNQPQIYLAQRAPQLRFFGGYWAFPGGVLEKTDAAGESLGEGLVACGVREVAEEIGVELAPDTLRTVCDITTPPFAPVRYATRFLHAELPDGQEPEIRSGELVEGRFWDAADALAAWRRGEIQIVPPALLLLELFSQAETTDNFLAAAAAEGEALAEGKLHPVRFSPGMFVAPLKTRTKPPATTTNTILAGQERIYIIDPATPDAELQQRLFAKIDAERAAGAELAGVVLTHHHQDHIGAVEVVCERYSLPLLAHEETFARLPFDVADKKLLNDGDRLELGTAPDGTAGWGLDVYHTPGHAPGHLAFRDDRYHALLAGDLCSTISSILVEPGDGHLGTYCATLERMIAMELGTIYPSHGPAHPNGRMVLQKTLDHRREREAKVVAALEGCEAPATIDDLLPVVYDDVEPALFPMASRSLRAGLDKLVEESRAIASDGDRWQLSV